MISSSIQHKLTRIRPPRVKITYDVETEGAEKKIELPFVIGIIGDYAGDNINAKDMQNEFVLVDTDNVDQFMQHVSPKLKYTVPKVEGEGNLEVVLNFKSREDFEILSIVKQIKELRDLHEKLLVLNEISVMIDGHDNLQKTLETILKDKNLLKTLEDDTKKMLKT